MTKLPRLQPLILMLAAALAVVACAGEAEETATPELAASLPKPNVSVVASGLINPVGMAELPDGGLLVAEEGTGEDDLSAGVSLITANGEIGRYISGLPSGRDAGDLSGVPLVAISPAGDKLYVGHFQFSKGHLWTLELPTVTPVTLRQAPYSVDDLAEAMLPSGNVALTNPFDLTFDAEGIPVVSDASGNGVAKETEDGRTRFIHRFDRLTDPANESLQIDAVPTGITRVGAEYFVTLTGGCPYPADSGQLVAIDEERGQRTVVDGLNMPIDVARGPDGAIWLLEFAHFEPGASCFTGEGYLPNTGRLSLLREDGSLEPVLTGLNYPGAVLPLADGSLYVSEVFAGRILHVAFGSDGSLPPTRSPAATAEAEDTQALIFHEVAADKGIGFRQGAFRESLSADPAAMMGAGLCWIDYDNDGWLDLYLVDSHALDEEGYWQEQGGLPRNVLYRNVEGVFVDVSAESKSDLALRGNGCLAADFDLDGLTDLYVTADGPNALLWNNGDGTFSEGAEAAGVAAEEWNTAAAVADVNDDGWPDLFVAAYIDLEKKIPNPIGAFPQDYIGLFDRLYLSEGASTNPGKVTFRDVALEAGLERNERGLGAVFVDVDMDGDRDLYIANDGQPNRLQLLEQSSDELGFRFRDVTREAGVGDPGSGMGIAAGDYDGNGLPDLFVTNWEREINALYLNQTSDEPDFLYSTYRIGLGGLGSGLTGWGTTWADFDQDTDLDLLVAHGRVPVTDLATDADLVRYYGNRLAEGFPSQFRNWTESAGLEAIGPMNSRGSAVADYDNDGDLDVAINTIGGPAALLQNDGKGGNWLQVEFDGFYPGAFVTLTLPDGRRLVRESLAGSSYLASEDPRLHFGLGEAETALKLEVRWPDGRTSLLEDVSANQRIVVTAP
jgi:hypothetical protein